MTDTAEAGSVAAEQPAGNPAQPTLPADNGSAAEGAKSWFDGLSEGNRKLAETKGWTTDDGPEKIVTSYAELERKIGEGLRVPAPDAPKEEWDKFHSRLPEDMRPVSSPDTLTYKLPEGLPEDLPYNEELAAASKQWAVELGASAKVAQGFHDKFALLMADQHKAQQAAVAQKVEATYDDLVKDLGPADSEPFKAKLAVADRTLKGLGLEEAFKETGILLPDGTLTNPQIARALIAVGDKMFSEDTIDHTPYLGGENPFKKLADGSRNVKAISALVANDPERAKRLAREAGENPDVWLGTNPR
jgi:hypothetical protein